MARAHIGTRQFLDPAVLARLGTLELKARVIVEGFLQGLHRSPFRGFSVEFAEYRQYMPGDDPASIDWKVYARSDRYYVKKFEHETNLPCHLLLDVSGSMGYGSHAVTKLQYATFLAAALAYLLNGQRDAVGLTTFDERIVTRLPPGTRPGHLRSVLIALERATAGTRSDLSRPLHDLAESIARRGLVIVVSDLLDEADRAIAGLRHLRSRGMEVIVFHVLDPAELTFPFETPFRFRDLESGEQVLASPQAVRDEYVAAMSALVAQYRDGLRSAGIDYCLVQTSQPLDAALLAYLSTRRRTLA